MTGRPYDDLTVQKETLVTVNNSTRPDENIPPTAEPRYNEPRYNEPIYNEPLYIESLYNEPRYNEILYNEHRYNEVPRYNERFLHPSHSKIYEKEPRYS